MGWFIHRDYSCHHRFPFASLPANPERTSRQKKLAPSESCRTFPPNRFNDDAPQWQEEGLAAQPAKTARAACDTQKDAVEETTEVLSALSLSLRENADGGNVSKAKKKLFDKKKRQSRLPRPLTLATRKTKRTTTACQRISKTRLCSGSFPQAQRRKIHRVKKTTILDVQLQMRLRCLLRLHHLPSGDQLKKIGDLLRAHEKEQAIVAVNMLEGSLCQKWWLCSPVIISTKT